MKKPFLISIFWFNFLGMAFLDFDFQTRRKRTHKTTVFTAQLTSLKYRFWIHFVKSQFRKTKAPKWL